MNNIKKEKYNKVLIIGFLIGMVLRLTYVNLPILEVLSEKQTHFAMIARNFYNNGFNLFSPQLDYLNNLFSFSLFQFNLFSFLVSLIYFISNGVYEYSARIVSVIFATGTAYLIYLFAKDIYNKKTGVASAIVFYLSPLSIIYTRTFLPDSMNMFFTVGAVYFCYKCMIKKQSKYYLWALFFSIFAFLVDIVNFYLVLPLVYIFISGLNLQKNYKNINQKTGIVSSKVSGILLFFKKIVSTKVLIFLLIIFTPVVLWWIYILNVNSIWKKDLFLYLKNYFLISNNFPVNYWLEFFKDIGGKTLTPVGLFFLIRAIFINKKDNYKFLIVWLVSVLIFMFVCCNLILEYDNYYLPFLIIASIFIGKEIAKENFGFKKKPSKYFLGFLKILLVIMVPAQISGAYTISRAYKYIAPAGRELERYAAKQDKVVATRRLYYCNRKGWRLDLNPAISDKQLIKQVEQYKTSGAKYLIITEIDKYTEHEEFLRYVLDTYKEIIVAKGYRIYKL
jgi:4-amino-4-deoxy-L-arabinose transferase-like glycosyltransferase